MNHSKHRHLNLNEILSDQRTFVTSAQRVSDNADSYADSLSDYAKQETMGKLFLFESQ